MSLENIEITCFKHENSSGSLFMVDNNMVGFSIKRHFWVTGKKGALRGGHAHKLLSQVVTCVTGTCELFLHNGINEKRLILTEGSEAVLIRPMVWAEQKYLEQDTVISVYCDRLYEEEDYIHNFQEYLSLVGDNK